MKFWALVVLELLPSRQGVEVIDLSKALRTGVPIAAQLNGSPTPHAPTDAPERKPPLSVEAKLSENQSMGVPLNGSIEITNFSTETLKLPTSPDGAAVYKACFNKRILHSYLIWGQTERLAQTAASTTELYGCDGLKGSTANLLPGGRLLFTGVRFPLSAGGAKGRIMTYSLDTWTFYDSAKGLTLDIRGILDISARFVDTQE